MLVDRFEVFHERDPTERFFGIGNETPNSGQRNYNARRLYGEAKIGLNITPNLQLQLTERPKYMRVLRGALGPEIPFIGLVYPTVQGAGRWDRDDEPSDAVAWRSRFSGHREDWRPLSRVYGILDFLPHRLIIK
jgi:hypothetical protein